MEFRKKLKIRLGVAIGYMVLGVLLCVVFGGKIVDNGYAFALGTALIAVGALQLWKYFRITKSDERVRKREIAEKDERNVSIAHRAKSAAFTVSILLVCAASIVLGIVGRVQMAQMLAVPVCVMVGIYLISYGIIRNKS